MTPSPLPAHWRCRGALGALLVVAWSRAGRADEVVVRGSRPDAFVSQAQEGEQPRQATDAASLLGPMPGVYVRRQGADDSFATLSIRGTSPQQSIVYLAGVPLNGGADPAMDLSMLPVWPGVRARVYRSFAPATLGRGSLGGALVLEAPNVHTPTYTETFLALGSYGAGRARAATLQHVGRAAVAAAVFGSRSDDRFDYLDPVDSRPGMPVQRARDNAGHAAGGGLLQVAQPLPLPGGREAVLTSVSYVQLRRQELPGTVRLPTPYQQLSSTRSVQSVELAVPTAHGALIAQSYVRNDTLALRDQPAFARMTASPSEARDRFLTVGGRLGTRQHPIRALRLAGFVDASREAYRVGPRAGAGTPDPAGRSSLGLAGEVEWLPHESLHAALHLRADAWSDVIESRTGGTMLASSPIMPSGHLGVEWRLAPGVSLATHSGRTARPPSFLERFGNQGAFLGNPSLRRESAFTQDLGLRLQRGGAGRALGLELVGFLSEARDLIQFVPQGAYGRARAENLGRARLLGLEALASARLGPLDGRVVYNLLGTQNRSSCSAARLDVCEPPPLPGRPTHVLVGDVGLRLGAFELRYGLDVVSGIVADRVGVIRVPARTMQFAGIRVHLPRSGGVTVGVDARNLADVRTGTYQGALGPTEAPIGDAYDYPLPGRTVLGFVRFSQPR